MLLSGFMFPSERIPKWERVLGEALPLTHLVRATRCVFFRGQCGSLVLCEMMPVAVFALIASAFALLAYRRRID
jgi:ABC-2 type transport system permease protein